ncbi:MAG: HAMP domain-containing sensor histidine kinase [Geitlerinemataceae cyanobacterium]
MNHVLLLIDRKENCRILAQWLTGRYQVIVPEVTSPADLETLNPAFDLCILDGMALNRLGEWVRSRKARELPVFLPFLLITPRQDINLATRFLWQEVDELILSPVEKLELQARLEILLRSRQLSRSLETANQKLYDLNQLKSRFISIASHEFRNPLNIISGSAQMLKRMAENLPQDRTVKLFTLIDNSVKKMLALLDDVLIVTRGELADRKVKLASIDLAALCRQIVQEMQLVDDNYHHLEFKCSDEFQDADVDEKLIRNIFINLLSNAIKYSPPNSTVFFELSRIDRTAILSICDRGIGIPEPDLPQLFEPFHRASNVRDVSGTGLGLAIVKQAVEIHNGTIEVMSKVNVGTTFTVRIPI